MDEILQKVVGVLHTPTIERDDYFYFENHEPIFSGHVLVDRSTSTASEYKYYYGGDGFVDEALFWKDHYERGKQFFHEGISLQEIITPCLTYRPRKSEKKEEVQVNLTYRGKTTGFITTRTPSIEIAAFGQSLFGDLIDVQIEAVREDEVVGRPASSEVVNSTTGYIEIEQGASMKFFISNLGKFLVNHFLKGSV